MNWKCAEKKEYTHTHMKNTWSILSLAFKFTILEMRRCSSHIENISMCHLCFITTQLVVPFHSRIPHTTSRASYFHILGSPPRENVLLTDTPNQKLWTEMMSMQFWPISTAFFFLPQFEFSAILISWLCFVTVFVTVCFLVLLLTNTNSKNIKN